MALIKFSGKPLEKLIESVRAGIGLLYKPVSIRNEADAEAYKIVVVEKARAEAEKQSNMIRLEGQMDIAQKISDRLNYQEAERQVNIENIISKAVGYLPEEVSETPVEKDWMRRFFTKAQDISNNDMAEIWGKLLASEINQPGSFSLRTLDIVSNLSPSEAHLFTKVCSLSSAGMHHNAKTHLLKFHSGWEEELNKYGITYDNVMTLRAAGLLLYEDDMIVTCHVRYPDDSLYFNGLELRFDIEKENNFIFQAVGFTPAGEELSYIVPNNPNMEFLKDFIEHYAKVNKGIKITVVDTNNTNV